MKGHCAQLKFWLLVTLAGSASAQTTSEPYRIHLPLGLDIYAPVPTENPLTATKVELGRRLFFDPILSADRSLSCSSCHRPEYAFSDTVALSAGVFGNHTNRNAPTLMNVAYGRFFFWDGRETSLEEQVLRPIQDRNEMGMHLDRLTERLKTDPEYEFAFAGTFEDGVTAENLGRALASFVRTLRAGDAPIDRIYAGDSEAFSSEERRGFRLFIGKANCATCHMGPTFSDGQFHNTGVSWGSRDLGRYSVTGNEDDRGAFKTPTLRNVALTAPYMHDGSMATLEEVIEFYDGGGKTNPNQDTEIRPLNLSDAEKEALLAFLASLTSGDH